MRRLDQIANHLSPDRTHEAAAASSGITVDSVERQFQKLRQTFLSGKTRRYAWRREQLTILVRELKKHKYELIEAIKKVKK
jgi:hypothetical protein